MSGKAMHFGIEAWKPEGGFTHTRNEGISLGLQIAQSRSCLRTSGPKISIIYVLGAPGIEPGKKDRMIATQPLRRRTPPGLAPR